MGVWECRKCGACCEILPLLIFGKSCEHYNRNSHLCMIYENRPEICRVSHLFGEEITERLCQLLRKLQRKE